ncbi:MAG: LamG-like jellyroll fold protein [Candidatus Magnetoglobus multicellularis str. Araruama]|uniref:LamG-like jellyroll fold protein n=1 Tax=Candidatus Magnetoglobus multicellularis str. Araruama TaxID=890399 RepID=A0A1V1NU68_9BACT|nr:MAG: LamG-like jellyroll fold protein [Candidatus Magnetoglobus multicellularis str. Araruama]
MSIIFTNSAFPDINDGLISYYPFTGNANDESANEKHGIISGAMLTEDRLGNTDSAFNFDGVDDFADMGVMNITLPLTVALWFNSSTINDNWDTLFGWNESSSPYNGIQIMANGYGKIKFRIGAEGTDKTSTSIIDGDSNWHFFVITRDMDNEVKLFVDGNIELTSTVSLTIGTNHNLYIGKSFRPDSYAEYFNGKIDDIRIYNRVLSENEIQSLYNLDNSFTFEDSDSDGVIDQLDLCADTPQGSIVYSDGCPAIRGDFSDNKKLGLEDCIGILQILSETK